MKLTLPDALHARPASLLVRAATQHACAIWVHKGEKRANAADILQVLALGAAKGEEVSLTAEGDGAEDALTALADLVRRNFDEDLVPERGAGAAAGIAVGEALVIEEEERAERARGTDDEERARTRASFARAREEVRTMIDVLPRTEAVLFEPELAILDALEPKILARIVGGAVAEDAVAREAAQGASDLVDDARRRLLDALAGSTAALAKRLEERDGRELVLVTPEVTPSLVASLPAYVVGVIAASDDAGINATGTTSHAAILARGRGLPLAYVPSHVAAAILDASTVVLDTTVSPAKVWSCPSEALIAEARARRDRLRGESAAHDARAREKLALVAVRVNVGSVHEAIPAGAEGIGLLRTELVFADRAVAPREEEQTAAYIAIARRAHGPVQIRLFDAGGDKPLPYLRAPVDDPEARGIALLRAHPEVLAAQLRAIARAATTLGADIQALIPLVRDAYDVEHVRRLAQGVCVAAMIETPAAARGIRAIAAVSDAISIGTNDLAAETLGLGRDAAPDPLDVRVLTHVKETVDGAHAHRRRVTVCGEVAADPHGARILVGLGVDVLSIAAPRFAALKTGLAGVTREDCQDAANRALSRS